MIGDMKTTKMGQFTARPNQTRLPKPPFAIETGFNSKMTIFAMSSPVSSSAKAPSTRLIVAAFLLLAGIMMTREIQAKERPAQSTASDAGPASETANANEDIGVSDEEFQTRSRSLFDGQILAGFEGDASWFRIEDECIVAGRLDQPIPKNQFLATTEKFDNFEFRAEIRMRGEGRNAGIQFRSRRPKKSDEVPPHEMIGFQADAGYSAERSIWGALYDESRRRRMLQLPEPPFEVEWKKPPTEQGTESIAPEQTDWIKMRIVCRGPRIQISLNGTQTVDYIETEEGTPQVGVIALQIHSGKPAEAWYRNLRILGLD
ncbi:3-keto-disaccharide hydrolase [Rhodopirellula bahusiensis]|uniref:3-keto-alpha-glucoside-1,2-lyase/3-keto-2-hydroxy-glucal hydratase domain-containing protein n=1 Tax=Rhodopirellula bahusiensis TaxID=2014065 RepID=A0A2G1W3K1_9BACT|nr:hypothetical protein CEE69_19535 [Rhodopirellula bahusiensis]